MSSRGSTPARPRSSRGPLPTCHLQEVEGHSTPNGTNWHHENQPTPDNHQPQHSHELLAPQALPKRGAPSNHFHHFGEWLDPSMADESHWTCCCHQQEPLDPLLPINEIYWTYHSSHCPHYHHQSEPLMTPG
uniref:Uncharacterized protein n=1 Tax=Molossus molossus TaxID=27622 RepID=A0A7J8I8A8_MOLMO|nr:hypothetical protein HJG59_010623 [Molossus molossus]